MMVLAPVVHAAAGGCCGTTPAVAVRRTAADQRIVDGIAVQDARLPDHGFLLEWLR
jgi:hypothetical protein